MLFCNAPWCLRNILSLCFQSLINSTLERQLQRFYYNLIHYESIVWFCLPTRARSQKVFLPLTEVPNIDASDFFSAFLS